MIPHQLFIHGSGDHVVSGHVVDAPNGEARALTDDDLAAIFPGIQADLIATIAQRDARIAALETALAAALAAPSSSGPDLSALDAAFESLVPVDLQPVFEPAWVTVRGLMLVGKRARAVNFVRSLAVPNDLESVRDQIATMLEGGA